MDSRESNTEDDYGYLSHRNIQRLRIGNYEFDTWYGNSALKLNQNSLDLLHICPFCFKYTPLEQSIRQHLGQCVIRTTLPGQSVYQSDEMTIRRIKGYQFPLFTQCMALLAKFFLDNKSVFYNINSYDFYVAYGKDEGVIKPMGFYSRHLPSWESDNLSCICVLPCYQKRGLGTLLIDFSYKLSNFENQISGPERPLSPFGKLAYLKYWCSHLVWQFTFGELRTMEWLNLEIISLKTRFRSIDIVLALDCMQVLYENGQKVKLVDYYSDNIKGIVAVDEWDLFIDRDKIRNLCVKLGITKDHQIVNVDNCCFY